MLVLTRHRARDAVPGSLADPHPETERGQACLAVLAERPGFVRGWLARAADDPAVLLLATEWVDVGSWRRALSPVDVRMVALPFLGSAEPDDTAFVVTATAGEGAVHDGA